MYVEPCSIIGSVNRVKTFKAYTILSRPDQSCHVAKVPDAFGPATMKNCNNNCKTKVKFGPHMTETANYPKPCQSTLSDDDFSLGSGFEENENFFDYASDFEPSSIRHIASGKLSPLTKG